MTSSSTALLTPNGRPSKALRQQYTEKGFQLFYDFVKRAWGVFSISAGPEKGLLYRTPDEFQSVTETLALWDRFSLVIKGNEEGDGDSLPSAWTVPPQEFWQDPLKYKIDLPTCEIHKGMNDGTLHKKAVSQAIKVGKPIPENVRSVYLSLF
jgi:hypothetical protein